MVYDGGLIVYLISREGGIQMKFFSSHHRNRIGRAKRLAGGESVF